ncbi:DUF4190 domain-containing protein [Pyxidicoccus xibeiensis]|uniref:DUF4190 domain-containing protein n=1 Tax=Pyxidicoccus xibeiensis TaxID=2906759 RepID=UPI0020A720BA|nr:DUF4190 domain-containing protein [Pyxidicoccus xibeiensis]MCP3137098.1 DUF4190 domain-containing protein [Pyxidicoccus xibeiensis]
MSVEVSPGALPRCGVHPEELAAATCQRCGGFICTACSTWVMGTLYCAVCAARPEVNYLEDFRRKYWGKRDSGAWLVGAGSLALVFLAVMTALGLKRVDAALALLAAAGVGVAFFLGMRWARALLLVMPAACVGFVIAPDNGIAGLGAVFILFVFALQLFLDTRSRLFFQVDVSEKALRRLWELRVNNPLARHAASLGFSSLFMPLFAPLAIILGVIALRRVDPQARPPIGRRGQALTGIVLGVASVLAWVLFLGPVVWTMLAGMTRL